MAARTCYKQLTPTLAWASAVWRVIFEAAHGQCGSLWHGLLCVSLSNTNLSAVGKQTHEWSCEATERMLAGLQRRAELQIAESNVRLGGTTIEATEGYLQECE